MPSSRQRARRSTNASGDRHSSAPTPPDSPCAVFSDSLSTSTPRRKDELAPTPSKKRRVENVSCSADEDDLNSSPLIGKRLWETFESNYKFLMEEDIIRTCQTMISQFQTGDQFGEETEESSSSSKVSLAEFLQQFSELSQWLTKLGSRRPTASSCRVEKYLDQGFAEELLQRQPRKKLLHDYARALLTRHPQMAAEVGDRLDSLEAQWSSAECHSAGLGSIVDPELLSQILADITDDVADLESWLSDLNEGLPSSHTWMQMVVRLGPAELKDRLKRLQAQQSEIESQSRCISHVIKVIVKLQQQLEDSPQQQQETAQQELPQFLTSAHALEDRCHAAWLQSLELLYCTEEQLMSPRQPPAPANRSEAPDQSAITALMPGNVPPESLERSDQTKESTPSSIEPSLRSKSTSFDVLPFSEDEYEKIAASSSSMRCQSIDLQGEAGQAAAPPKTALLAADLCYDDPDISRGIALRQKTTRELTVHRQEDSASLPGPVMAGDVSSSLFTSDWEISSTEWRTTDSSQLFGPSRSAEVLLGEEVDLDVSQVHAVLSVTPKKAYYRMTAVDHELTNDSISRPPRTSVSAPEGFVTQQEEEEEGTEREGSRGGGGGGGGEEEEVETLVSPGPSPDLLLTSTPCVSAAVLPGQKRRYSRSFCPPPRAEGVTCGISPVLASAARRQHEKSTSDSSAAMEAGARSGSWRELIGQLERDVRFSGSGSLVFRPAAPEDDTGSLADESASSGAGESSGQRAGVNRTSGGRVRRIRHRMPTAGLDERRRSTSMQLAEQAEKIVAARSCLGADDTDSQASEEFDEPDSCGPVTEDSLMQAWDNYQPMYPSGCEDDGEEEEKLDLLWDEQLEASIHDRIQRRRDQESGGDWEEDVIEEMLSRSSQILERARNSLGCAPPPQDALASEVVPVTAADVTDRSSDSDAAELERELSRQQEWLRACENNLTCLDHLKESLTDSGVEDDLDPIRQQVEHLYKEWLAFKEETLARLGLIETLRHVHEEADIVKREAQRLADLMDAPAEQRFHDRAQLDKFVSVLEDYMSQIPEWRRTVQAMHQDVLGSLENDQVDYLDVRRCYAENLHLLSQWIFSLYSRTEALQCKMATLCERHSALLAQLLDVEVAVGREELVLRCTRITDLIEADALKDTCRDLQALSGRLLALGDNLDKCLRSASCLGPHFAPEHWQHMDSRLTCAANRLAQLQEACAALLSAVSAEVQARGAGAPESLTEPPVVEAAVPKRDVAPAAAEPTWAAPPAAAAAPSRRRQLWRLLRASLPYQLALLVLFGCFYFLLADDCPLTSRLLLSPQLRYAFGSPY